MLAFICGFFRPPNNVLRNGRAICTPSSSSSSSSSSRTVTTGTTSLIPATAATNRSLSVLITGGTKGVGRALAEGFLKVNDTVLITSRDEIHVRDTLLSLREAYPEGKLYGYVTDVRNHGDVQRLLTYASETLGSIDAFICNAGTVGRRRGGIDEQDPSEDLKAVVDTNLLGTLYCAKEAMRVGREFQTDVSMHVFLMDGSGTFGNATPDAIAYGATKRAVPQLIKSLNKQGGSSGGGGSGGGGDKGGSKVKFHQLSPGMVLTDLLLRDSPTPNVKRIFNMLAEEPRTVADDLVPRIRTAVKQDRNNQYIAYLTIPKALYRLSTGFLLGFRKNLFFDEVTGDRVDADGRYNENGVRIE